MIDTVVIAYNFSEQLEQLTRNTFASLKETGMGKLIVVDNASTFGAGYARQESDIYIRNKENVGYTKAVNQGFYVSETPYVAISNNDIRISKDWVEVTEEIFKNPEVGTVHFRMVPYEQEIVPGNDVWIGGKERWCHCSFFVIRREAFLGYDTSYGAGGYDDYDHLHRMRQNGWKQAYTNKCSFQHMDSITYRTMELPDKRSERDIKNREYYKSKFGEYPDIQFNQEFGDQLSIPYFPFP